MYIGLVLTEMNKKGYDLIMLMYISGGAGATGTVGFRGHTGATGPMPTGILLFFHVYIKFNF